MDVFLMQHGEAVAAEADPDRPLTGEGRQSVISVARHAAACGIRPDRIVHSGKTRAAQSAELLAQATGCTRVDQVPGLKPSDSVVAAAGVLVDAHAEGSIAIVGHLPFLDRFAALLVAGDQDAHVVAFRNGGLVRLVPSGARFAVSWAVTPEVARPPQ